MDLEEYIGKLLVNADKIPTRYVYKIEIKFANGEKEVYPGDFFLVNTIGKRVNKTDTPDEYTIVSYRMLIDVDRLIEDSRIMCDELMSTMFN